MNSLDFFAPAGKILTMATIVLVEDNDSIREAVASYLRLEEMEVLEFGRLRGVLEAVRMRNPDLIILDVLLPDGDGFELARRIRSSFDIPILFLTARTAESDRITGFEVGGDDYVVKPFSPRELTLRVRSILRRTVPRPGGESGRWELDGDVLVMDERTHRALLNGREIPLTAAEWKILHFLAGNSGIVLSRDRILGGSLDYMADGSERTVDTHVKNIRLKLKRAGWIETVRGFGYRFTGREEG
jgi:DNA-binding response OmpR family regulator